MDRLNGGDSAGRPVQDRSGLSGIYVFDFLAHNSADLVESIEDQSGLRFEPSNARMEMVTIEHAERPNPD